MIIGDIDFKDISAINRATHYIKARHIAGRILDVLDDYYKDSGVEILDEIDLPDMLTSEIQTCLFDIK